MLESDSASNSKQEPATPVVLSVKDQGRRETRERRQEAKAAFMEMDSQVGPNSRLGLKAAGGEHGNMVSSCGPAWEHETLFPFGSNAV